MMEEMQYQDGIPCQVNLFIQVSQCHNDCSQQEKSIEEANQ